LRTFTDVGASRGAEGKPCARGPLGVRRDLLAARNRWLSGDRHDARL